jgi:50S ribosomal protein L16 3-hydroxylase
VGALSDWLGPTSLEDFRKHSFGSAPFARPASAARAAMACTWETLDRMLGSAAPDVLVVSRGQLVDAPEPRSLAELRALFARGAGVVIRGADRLDRGLGAVTAHLLEDVPGEARVLVFATPRGTHGFGWHYDAEEVFIVQTEGEKEYLMQANTVDPAPRRGAQPDFSTHRLERTPRMSCRLRPSDWLYVPRGFWHVAHPHEDSLSISIGIFPSASSP